MYIFEDRGGSLNRVLMLLFVFVTLSQGVAVAQAVDTSRLIEVKTSGNFYWGEAFSTDADEARTRARQDLIERISVQVTSDSEIRLSEDDERLDRSFDMRSSTISRMQLRGSDYIAVERPDGSWRVTAFISIEDFYRSLEIESGRMLSKLRQARIAEENGNIGAAMRLWMEVLGGTAFFPQPLYTSAEEHGSEAEARQFVRSKITEWLEKTSVEVHNIENRSSGDNTELYLKLDIRQNNLPANLLTVGIARPGFGQHSVTNGRARIFLDRARDSAAETLILSLEPVAPESLPDEYKEVVAGIRFGVQKTLEVDWADVVTVSFEAVRLSDTRFRLIPETTNLSIFDLTWHLPDNRRSTDSTPVYHFETDAEFADIRLEINRSPRLSVNKRLYRDGRLLKQQPRLPIAENEPESRPASPERRTAERQRTAAPAPAVRTSPAAVLDDLFRLRSAERLLSRLRMLSEEGVLELSTNRAGISDESGSYIAVINPANGQVQVILSPLEHGQRTLLPGSRTIAENEISTEFQNMGVLWFRFN